MYVVGGHYLECVPNSVQSILSSLSMHLQAYSAFREGYKVLQTPKIL